MKQDSLLSALEAFIDPVHLRVWRGSKYERQILPSLWEQLIGSSQWSGSNSGGGVFGSRPVISTEAVSLVMEITETITEAAQRYGRIIWKKEETRVGGCWCKPYQACRGYRVQSVGRDHAAELRAIAANCPPEMVPRWIDRLGTWTSKARAVIGLNTNHPTSARKIACPKEAGGCGATRVAQKDDDRVIWIPALGIAWATPEGEEGDYHEDHEYLIRAVECRACKKVWWRGPELDTFASAVERG